MAGYDESFSQDPQQHGNAVQGLMAWAGALTSVALVIGVGIWGYQLTVRDVSGVPVIRALEGPLREAPENPGGSQIGHQGLAVNRVAAVGEAAPPADRLLLAPKPVDMTDADKPRAALPPVTRPQFTTTPQSPSADAAIGAPAPVDAVLALLNDLTEGEAPLSPLAPLAEPVDPVEAAVAEAAATPEPVVSASVVPASVPGLKRSPMPKPRPAGDLAVMAALASASASTAVATPAPQAEEMEVSTILPGTNLVQLGAFDSPEVARAEWQRLASKFESFMVGKQRLVQSAVSGGRTFYRLRAVGFSDISDARRFCAALTAEKAACIPVVAR